MMRSAFRLFPGLLFPCIAVLALPVHLVSQAADAGPVVAASAVLPESPQPHVAQAADSPQDNQALSQTPSAQDSSSSQAPAAPTDDEKSKREKAAEQLKAQEKQRVMGVMATFNTTSNKDALPLSPGQKFQLFFKSETDPWPFLLASVVAGFGQAEESYPEWGQGMQGYAKRFGGAYTDAFIGNFFGNAVLTVALHEDPRYFQKGAGSRTKRFLWAASSTVWCKRDNGKWGPNYANVGGNLIGSAIARSYYPVAQRTVNDTISDGLTVSAEGIVGSEVIEFWPDIARHFKRKHAEKLARQAAAQSTPQASTQDTTKK
jgi:hypothetical protein